MWVVGDWGQSSPWTRDTGVKMVKGENDVWTGKLSLPKDTKFDIKILKSTVSATSGGNNTWSAVRYANTLNLSASHDFGEFTDNLIPNGNFDEGQVKWTPAECILTNVPSALSGEGVLAVGGDNPHSCTSDVFTIPPNQKLRLTGYIRNLMDGRIGVVTMKVVAPQQKTLFELSNDGSETNGLHQFSRTFKTGAVQTECQIVISSDSIGNDWQYRVYFDSLSIVSP